MAFLGQLPGKSTLGNRIGSDLAEGLQGLAQHKMQQKQSHELEKIGFPKQLASIFHTLDPKVQEGIWKQVNLSNIGQLQQQGQQAIQAQQPQMQPTFTPEQTEFIKSIPSPLDRQKVAQQFQMQNQQQQQAPISSQPSQQFGQAAAQQQVAEQLAQQQQKPQSIFEGANASMNPLERQQALASYKDQINQDKEQRKIEYEDVKESKKWLKEKNKKAKGIKENELRLDRMKKLIDTGKLSSPEFAAGLDSLAHGIMGFGINLKSLQSTESQEFEKLSNDMLKGIQDIFGSRILKTEVDNFMKTIPTLTQSDAGKIAVIDNLKLLGEASLKEDQLAKQIVRQNGGQVPANLEQLVEEQLGDYLDDVHERFVNQVHEVPKSEKTRSGKLEFAKKAFKFGLTGAL
jgi:hypothetical protein